MVQVFVWGGILIDLLAAPCLLWKRTRTPMFCALLLFHLMNSTLFHIGVFPWLMMALTTLFFRPDWPRRLFRVSGQSGKPVSARYSLSRTQGILLSLYVLIQIVLPLRHFPTGEDPSWTERGHQFAWRMMLREKQTGIRFIATEVATGRTGEVDVRPYVTPRQAAQISRNPDLAVQFAHWLADKFRRMGLGDTEIRAKCLVSLNGRRPQLLFDPTVDLASEPRRLGGYPWILPLTEPLRHDAWSVPLAEWEQMPELSSLANDAVSVAADDTSRQATP